MAKLKDVSKLRIKSTVLVNQHLLPTHTQAAYGALQNAYSHFNKELFNNALPHCLITLQRKSHMRGYFANGRFGVKDTAIVTDEIALNPSYFKDRTTEQVMSTLVHEMCHVWQQHFGKPPRKAYHNKEWASQMMIVGLMPSDTGLVGGKQTGQKVTHYIIEKGPYQKSFAKLPPVVLYNDLWSEQKAAKKAPNSKTKFTCPGCGCNAWGKPDLNILCNDCYECMVVES